MAENDFMNGDKSLLKKTKVLHKDHNYMNFDKKDLEWVEENSHEYQEYIKKKQTDIDELKKKTKFQ